MIRTELGEIIYGISRAHLCKVAKTDASRPSPNWRLGIGLEAHRQASILITGKIFDKWMNGECHEMATN